MKFACLIGLILLIQPGSRQENYLVPSPIPVLRQPKDMDCWITVATMMLSWRDKTAYTVGQTAARLGDPWKLYFDTNTGLPENEQERFIRKIGLTEEPPANYLIGAYLDMLKKYGPVWIITGNLLGAHARLLIGMEGSDHNAAKFILIDPFNGRKVSQNALAFLQEFDAEAKIANKQNWKNLRIQLYHF